MRFPINEEEGQIYSEAHAKELLSAQIDYNNKIKILNDQLAKKKSDLAVKYMNAVNQTPKTQPQPNNQTGTVDTAGNPTNAQGSPPAPTVESYPNILRIKAIDEEFVDKYAHVPMHKRNWYQKPEAQANYEEPKKIKRKKLSDKVLNKKWDIEGEIEDLKHEIKSILEPIESPNYEGIEGEIENFFGEIGFEAADILNSGGYKHEKEKIRALEKIGITDPKGTLKTYYYYYPEFNTELDIDREKSQKQIAEIENKISKLEAKLEEMESMYENVNERNVPEYDEELDKMEIFVEFEHVFLGHKNWPKRVKEITDENELPTQEIVDAISNFDKKNMKKYLEELEEDSIIYVNNRKNFIESNIILAAACAAAEGANFHKFAGWGNKHWTDFLYPWGSTRDLQYYRRNLDESLNEAYVNESAYDTKNVDPYEFQNLKDYLDAENISYIEDEEGTSIDFDETELDKEWKDRIIEIGLEENDTSPDDILSIEDDDIEDNDTEDVTTANKKIDEDKVFHIKVEDEGEAFIGKIYKLFDEGEWRSKVIDGESETFEKLNYDPDWDEIDIIAFLRENYADAEIISEDDFNDHAENPESEEIEEALRGNGNILVNKPSIKEDTKLEPNLGGKIDMKTQKILKKNQNKNDDELKNYEKEVTEKVNETVQNASDFKRRLEKGDWQHNKREFEDLKSFVKEMDKKHGKDEHSWGKYSESAIRHPKFYKLISENANSIPTFIEFINEKIVNNSNSIDA